MGNYKDNSLSTSITFVNSWGFSKKKKERNREQCTEGSDPRAVKVQRLFRSQHYLFESVTETRDAIGTLQFPSPGQWAILRIMVGTMGNLALLGVGATTILYCTPG